MNSGRGWSLVLAGLLWASAAAPAPTTLRILVADFETETGASTGSSGSLTYEAGGRWRVRYRSPMLQDFVVSETLATVFYPAHRKVIRFRDGRLQPPKMLEYLVLSLASNRDLAATGLKPEEFETRGDTTITVWKPAVGAARETSSLRVRKVGARCVQLESLFGGAVRTEFRILAFVKSESAELPSMARLLEHEPEGSVLTDIRYSAFRFDSLDPARAFDQRVPEGWAVEDAR